LPPLLPALRDRSVVRAELGLTARQRLAVIYLNPFFQDAALADALDDSLAAAGFAVHAVGVGYATRPGWRADDPALGDAIGAADVFVSAAGAGGLAIARATGVPMIALATDQPEQRKNLASIDAGACWRAVVELAGEVRTQLARALADVPPIVTGDGQLAARRTRTAWLQTLMHLVAETRNRKDRP
jgi:hypothetical protein